LRGQDAAFLTERMAQLQRSRFPRLGIVFVKFDAFEAFGR
jgi:hypothetical protein